MTKKHDNISTDELEKALEITDMKNGADREMLKEILRFGDTTASEVMTPRVDITDLDIAWNFDKVMEAPVRLCPSAGVRDHAGQYTRCALRPRPSAIYRQREQGFQVAEPRAQALLRAGVAHYRRSA